ncbi:hypothetical protein C5167_000188 [Papaver somniferum]|uniref:Uncharacterized protein n=1 Tax=Papaver somniferum TaxID=3469 RepID=A0A4Y7KR38_PAPSO|nr:hypothetical protein C5167_000188 [Papaver somniferum]
MLLHIDSDKFSITMEVVQTSELNMWTRLRRCQIIEEPEDKREERHMAKQAQLGVWLKMKVKERLLGVEYCWRNAEM